MRYQRTVVIALCLVVMGCGMNLGEALPLLEADVVEITEHFFPDQDYELRLGPTGGDLTGCYYPVVDSYLLIESVDWDRDALLDEMRTFIEGKGLKVTNTEATDLRARFEADHPGGTLRVSIGISGTTGSVYVTGSAGACTRSPRSWTVTRHSPPAEN